MGIFVRYLSEIPRMMYEIYVVYLASPYGNTAEKVISVKFEQIAFDIGSENVIANILTWEGVKQAEQKFNISAKDLRPILIITDVHPEEWTPKHPLIKLQLGKINEEDKVRNFLFRFSKYLASGDFGKIKWENRFQRLKQLKKFFPIEINLISVDINLGNL